MNKITKNNLNNFMEFYNYFHDSYIKKINYDLDKNKIYLFINVFWVGEPIKNENNYYETNRTKMKITFTGIKEYKDDSRFSDYIDEAIIEYVELNNKEYIFFASDEAEPSFCVISDTMEYEEYKENSGI